MLRAVTDVAVTPLEHPVDADVTVPGSKSITNRYLLIAALASGESTLSGVLRADDTEAMLDCARALGATVELASPAQGGAVQARVVGTSGRIAPSGTLNARQSGTTARFVLPVAATAAGPWRVDGDGPLRARPMGPLIDALRSMGAKVSEEGTPGHLPVSVEGGLATAQPAHLEVPGTTSSQFLSGLLMSAPLLAGGLTLSVTSALVSQPYVDLTLRAMEAFGAHVEAQPGRYVVRPGGYRGAQTTIEPDASAASYLFAAAALSAGRVLVKGLTAGSAQGDTRFVDLLEAMGASVDRRPDGIEVRGTSRLVGLDKVDMSDVSDTVPTLAVVAAFAEGTTRITGVGFIRAKESDRIAAVVSELRRCGIAAEEEPDGLVVHGGEARGARIHTYDDHRIAMSFALVGLRVPGITIADAECVAKTFPDFFDVLDQLRT
jgi:3-phosphoshikimate 1-carboxyvinyltransferase